MAKTVLVDTGPIIALIDSRDYRHTWAVDRLNTFSSTMITCTPVITECIFLLQRNGIQVGKLLGFIEDNIIEVQNPYPNQYKKIHSLLVNYQNINTSLADICLVSMSEDFNYSEIFTIDSDFHIYRDSKGNPLNLISPYRK